jgi:hypothetical protein
MKRKLTYVLLSSSLVVAPSRPKKYKVDTLNAVAQTEIRQIDRPNWLE